MIDYATMTDAEIDECLIDTDPPHDILASYRALSRDEQIDVLQLIAQELAEIEAL